MITTDLHAIEFVRENAHVKAELETYRNDQFPELVFVSPKIGCADCERQYRNSVWVINVSTQHVVQTTFRGSVPQSYTAILNKCAHHGARIV